MEVFDCELRLLNKVMVTGCLVYVIHLNGGNEKRVTCNNDKRIDWKFIIFFWFWMWRRNFKISNIYLESKWINCYASRTFETKALTEIQENVDIDAYICISYHSLSIHLRLGLSTIQHLESTIYRILNDDFVS